MKFTSLRLGSSVALLSPLAAMAHPGHDDPDITWDFDHLIEHPAATILCFTVIAAGAWFAWRLARRQRASKDAARHLIPRDR